MGDIGDFIQFPIGKKDQFDRKLRRCMIISLLNEIQKDPHRLDKRLISFGRIPKRGDAVSGPLRHVLEQPITQKGTQVGSVVRGKFLLLIRECENIR